MAIAQFSQMHYHYRLRMSSRIDRDFFWNTLLGSKEVVANDSSSKHKSTANPTAVQSSANATTTTTTTTTAVSAIQKKFESIPTRTIDLLASLYVVDLHLWQHFLEEGTPREEGEETMYDYYIQTRKVLPRLPQSKPQPTPPRKKKQQRQQLPKQKWQQQEQQEQQKQLRTQMQQKIQQQQQQQQSQGAVTKRLRVSTQPTKEVEYNNNNNNFTHHQ
jgi:hypothetical protein